MTLRCLVFVSQLSIVNTSSKFVNMDKIDPRFYYCYHFSDIQKRTVLHFHSSVASTRKASRIYGKTGLLQIGSVDAETE